MNADMVEGGLAVIGAGTCLYWVIRALTALVRWVQPPPEPSAAVPDAAAPAVPAAVVSADADRHEDDVAAIAAAVYSLMQSHRIIHIEDAHGGAVWQAEGRWMHQTSHQPH